jgi:hypothetical protein
METDDGRGFPGDDGVTCKWHGGRPLTPIEDRHRRHETCAQCRAEYAKREADILAGRV